ncbi:MAG TPA: DUF4149 domain-containing protein [Acidobacteriaceae bacterium]|jgi:hypothetical protein|nr:DUF4149 domain-containing protein [Acidobacteriaceae bacterium]
MATLFRALRLFALAAWVGGIFFFTLVAGIAFKVLPDPHNAGLVVRSALIDVHRIGTYAAVVYLLATLALLAMQRDSHPFRVVELALVLSMLALTLYSQISILPRMETDRLSLGGDVDTAPRDAPARRHFERLHSLSVKFEAAVLLEGLALLALAPVHGREDHINSLH